MNLFYSRVRSILRKGVVFPFLILIILLLISISNKFPEGYIYSYSDFYQLFNYDNKIGYYSDTFVDNGEGRLNFLYVPFYYFFLGLIQKFVGPQNMEAVYCFMFLAGAFLSFYIATRFYGIDKKRNINTMLCFSLLYAVNSYTAIRYALPSMFFLPYIFIPVLFATVHAYFMKSDVLNRNLLWCSVAMLASTACWAGPPFFVAYSLLTFVYIVLLFIFYRKYSLFILAKKSILYYFVFVISFSMYIFTWPLLMSRVISEINTGQYKKMLEWLYSQSLTMFDVFSFRTGLFGLVNINEINFAFFFTFCFSLFALFVFSLLSPPKSSLKKTLTVFGLMVLTIIFFLNKGKGFPWQAPVHSLFEGNIILSSLRSFDKTLIFLPFMLLMPSCLGSAKANHKIIPWILLAVTFIFSYPLIYGDIYKKYAYVDQGKDYLTSRYAPLVKIPQGYFDMISRTNRIKSDFRVFSVPWSLENPDLIGWIISPKWKHIGSSLVIAQYFNRPYVQMNAPNEFRGWNYGADWNIQGNNESLWLMQLSGMLNAKHFIFQKDAPEMFVSQAVSKINFYKEKGLIKLLASNPYFDFFEISDTYFLPHFYVPDKLYSVEKPSNIPFVLENARGYAKPAILESYNGGPTNPALNYGGVVIEYKKINTTKYKVNFHGITKSFPLVFSETFYPFWRIYPKRHSENNSGTIETYKIFEHNEAYQATKEELETYIEKGWVSELGDGSAKKRKEVLWTSFNTSQSYEERYRIDYVSKKMKGTIQNDNIADGHFYDTWSLEPIDEKFHQIANGYANYWQIDMEYLKNTFPGNLKENTDGSYDLEVIVEFWPQKVLNISRAITIAFAAFICILLIRTYVFKKDETPTVP